MSEENERSETLSFAVKMAFGIGNMVDILGVNGLWFPYASAFYAKVLQLGASEVGTIFLVAQISGGIFAPMMGIISDLTRCPLYGSRKFFHLLGLVAFVGSFFFLWHDCFGCGDRFRTTFYSSFTVVFEFGFMTMQITQLALLPELASTKQSKVELNSIRLGMNFLARSLWHLSHAVLSFQVWVQSRWEFALFGHCLDTVGDPTLR